MCWSYPVSVAMVGIGSAATVHTFQRGLPRAIWLTIGYFTVMEALQASGYLVVDRCGTHANSLIAALSFLHIVFQPFFINAFSMELLPKQINRRIRVMVYGFCFASSAVTLLQLYPFNWVGACKIGEVLCGGELCLRSGGWHIAWDIPYNGLALRFNALFGTVFDFPLYAIAYASASFILPALYGAWRLTAFHLIVGPVLAVLLTNNANEWPAIWCLFSIGIILVALFPILMQQFRVERWFLWPQSWTVDLAHQ
jgi:hypothetical protein